MNLIQRVKSSRGETSDKYAALSFLQKSESNASFRKQELNEGVGSAMALHYFAVLIKD
jgi:hypothetical protein